MSLISNPPIADPLPVSVAQPIATTISDTGSIDAFNRTRVSNPFTIFDSKQIFDTQPLFWDDQEVSGSGTGTTYFQAGAMTRMDVSNLTAGKRVRQTFMRFNYQPGKSQQIFMTGVLGNAGTGITVAMGQFDDDNGIFLSNSGGVTSLTVRGKMTGVVVDNTVDSPDWNIDPMDGTGPSGYDLDPSKAQILMIDYEWLGVGRVRCGFVIDGIVYYVHQFVHANVIEGVYMSSPNLPLRYSIENDGTGGVAYLDHICSSIITEGGQQDLGVLRHVDNPSVTASSAGTHYGLIGLRLKTTSLGAVIDLINAAFMCTTNNDYGHWELRLNPTVAGTFTYADVTNSSIQVANGVAANTVTGGYEIDGGYYTQGVPVASQVKNAIRLGASIAGVRDEMVISINPLSGSQAIHASVTWRELS